MFFCFVAAFVAGVSFLQTRAALPDGLFALVLPPLLVCAWFFLRRESGREKLAGRILILFFAAAAGFFWASLRAEWRLAESLPPELEWREIVVEGKVEGFAEHGDRASRFLFAIERVISPRPQKLKLIARLSDYHRGGEAAGYFSEGARLRMKIKIRPPRESANPHGFDYAGRLFAHNIRAIGYVRDRENITVLAPGRDGLRYRISRQVRELFARENGNNAADKKGGVGALLAALTVGDRAQMSKEQWRVLQITGTAHLFSISGVHLGIVAAFAAFFISFLWRRSSRLTRMMPAAKASLIFAFPATFSYALLAGLAVPVTRSFLMLAAAGVAVLAGGISSALVAIAFAALFIVVWDPWSVLSAGFWLSFAFVAALIVVMLHGRKNLWRRIFAKQFLLSLCAIPLTIWFFNRASLISPPANLFAIPLIGGVVLPLALADLFAPGDFLWRVAGWILAQTWSALEWASLLPFAAWQPASPPGWLFAAAIAGALLLLAPSGFPMRAAGFLPVLAMLLWRPPPVAEGAFRATVLDVGQGAAIVIHTANRVLLYDAGPRYAARTVGDYLRGEGARELDAMIVSHDDSDHSGGAEELLAEMPTARVLSSSPSLPGAELCEAGQKWKWDGVSFSVLHPAKEDYGAGFSDNDMSCVLHIAGARGSFLLAGDLSADAERFLLARYAESGEVFPGVSVLSAPHHGSRHSSSAEFIAAANPKIVVFSSGSGNRYGHPHPETLTRYKKTGATPYDTGADGAVLLHFPAGNTPPKITGWRNQSLKYWHRQR